MSNIIEHIKSPVIVHKFPTSHPPLLMFYQTAGATLVERKKRKNKESAKKYKVSWSAETHD
jgi:hypothetical protein